MFPVYGFGGYFNNATHHCFPLTFNPASVEVPGVAGILAAYENSFRVVTLSGPTNFAEVVNTVAATASRRCSQADQQYHVLVMLTDGEITDFRDTVDAIVAASYVPMSIIIIGVGCVGPSVRPPCLLVSY